MQNKKICKHCMFFVMKNNGAFGQCHRMPRTESKDKGNWCGEFIEKQKAVESGKNDIPPAIMHPSGN